MEKIKQIIHPQMVLPSSYGELMELLKEVITVYDEAKSDNENSCAFCDVILTKEEVESILETHFHKTCIRHRGDGNFIWADLKRKQMGIEPKKIKDFKEVLFNQL